MRFQFFKIADGEVEPIPYEFIDSILEETESRFSEFELEKVVDIKVMQSIAEELEISVFDTEQELVPKDFLSYLTFFENKVKDMKLVKYVLDKHTGEISIETNSANNKYSHFVPLNSWAFQCFEGLPVKGSKDSDVMTWIDRFCRSRVYDITEYKIDEWPLPSEFYFFLRDEVLRVLRAKVGEVIDKDCKFRFFDLETGKELADEEIEAILEEHKITQSEGGLTDEFCSISKAHEITDTIVDTFCAIAGCSYQEIKPDSDNMSVLDYSVFEKVSMKQCIPYFRELSIKVRENVIAVEKRYTESAVIWAIWVDHGEEAVFIPDWNCIVGRDVPVETNVKQVIYNALVGYNPWKYEIIDLVRKAIIRQLNPEREVPKETPKPKPYYDVFLYKLYEVVKEGAFLDWSFKTFDGKNVISVETVEGWMPLWNHPLFKYIKEDTEENNVLRMCLEFGTELNKLQLSIKKILIDDVLDNIEWCKKPTPLPVDYYNVSLKLTQSEFMALKAIANQIKSDSLMGLKNKIQKAAEKEQI